MPDVLGQVSFSLPAMVEKYIMALLHKEPHNMWADELGPANDQNAHDQDSHDKALAEPIKLFGSPIC